MEIERLRERWGSEAQTAFRGVHPTATQASMASSSELPLEEPHSIWDHHRRGVSFLTSVCLPRPVGEIHPSKPSWHLGENEVSIVTYLVGGRDRIWTKICQYQNVCFHWYSDGREYLISVSPIKMKNFSLQALPSRGQRNSSVSQTIKNKKKRGKAILP